MTGDVSSGRVARVGFVVGRQVGNAVTRNRVKRRLRHLVAARLAQPVAVGAPLASDPGGFDLVIRALPQASDAGRELVSDLEHAWNRVEERLGNAADSPAHQRVLIRPTRVRP